MSAGGDPKVVILCGGLGTRLREETEYRPKPMVTIGDRPILWHIMKGFSSHGFRDFVLCLGYKGEKIKEYFYNYDILNTSFTIELGSKEQVEFHYEIPEADWRVTLADTGEHAMTGARVRRIAKYIEGDRFLLTYGDGVSNVDVRRLLEFHRAHGKTATVTGVHPPSRFGELVVDDAGRVLEFAEKPQARGSYINGGFFVCERSFFDYLDDDDGCVLENEPLERLAAAGELMTYRHDGFWACMDTYRDFSYLNDLWSRGEAPWRVWDRAPSDPTPALRPMGTQGAFDAAYAGRRVLVTGDTGFKGTWLWQWLEALGAEVHGLALPPPTTPSLWEQAALDREGRHREGDVRDPDAVAAQLDTVQPEAIFHLAAQSIVRESYEAPLPTFATNVMGVAHVVDALRANPRPCAVVIVTSDKCYAGEPGTQGHTEGDALGGRDPYSASKGAAEIVTAAYRESFFPADEHDRHGVGIASVRSGNVIGPGDWARDRIVPDAIRALSAGEAVPVRNPGATRPWQHVLEPLAGYLWVGARLLGGRPAEACQAWNFGPALEACRPVREIVDAILKAWGDGRWETAAPGGPPESPTLALAIDKAAAELDWQPVWELGEAIERTVHGYRALLEAPDTEAVRALMTREIEAYTTRAIDAGRSWAAGAA